MEERKIPIHDLKRETYCFEEFVVSVLEKKTRVERFISKNIQSDRELGDIFLRDGFPGYTNIPTFVIVKYSKNKDKIHELVEFLESKNNTYKYVIITFADTGTKLNPYYDGKVIVLGVDYIDNLAKNNPYEWWIFSASCSDDNRMVFDPNNNSIHISQISLAGMALNIDIELQANEKTFGMISTISEKDFKRRIKTDKSPALFIGNGVSFHFGSDSWNDLSESLFDYLKPAHIDYKDEVKRAIGDTNYSVTGMSQYLIDSKKYYNAIYYSIYRKYDESMHLDNTLIRSITKLKE